MHLQLNALFLPLIVFATLLSTGCGEPAYDLQPIFTQGEIRREVSKMTMTGTLTCTHEEQMFEGTMEVVDELAVETDILAVKGGQPTRLRRAMLSSRGESSMNFGGESEVTTEVDPLAGRSVLLTQVDGSWKGRLVGGSPSPEQTAGIVEMEHAETLEDIVPARELRIGESWVIGGERFRRYLGETSASSSGQMKLRFEQIVEFNGESCALLSVQLDVSLPSSPHESPQGTFKISAEGHIYRSLASRLDLSTELRGNFELVGELVQEDGSMPMTAKGPIVITSSVTRDY